jgi:Flp pilus assembly protein TadD
LCSGQGSCCIIRACTELIRSEPNNVVAYNHLGNALRSTGQLTLAIEDHSKAIGIDATNAVAYANRCMDYIQTAHWIER